MPIFKRACVVLLLIVASACGGGSTTTSPTPTPTPSTFSLSGQVTNASSTGISGATVSIGDGSNAGKSATTDVSGNYSFTGLQQSGFTLAAGASGYVSSSKSVTLTSNQTVSFQLTLSLTAFDGTWSYTSQSVAGNSRQFIVRNGVVTSFTVTQTRFQSPGNTNPCTNTVTLTPNIPIADSKFAFSADVRATILGGLQLYAGPVAGTFATTTSGSVTEGSTTLFVPVGGGSPVAFASGVQCGASVTVGIITSPTTLATFR